MGIRRRWQRLQSRQAGISQCAASAGQKIRPHSIAEARREIGSESVGHSGRKVCPELVGEAIRCIRGDDLDSRADGAACLSGCGHRTGGCDDAY
jgi:hypothetical protein